jgi:hypothetical protein
VSHTGPSAKDPATGAETHTITLATGERAQVTAGHDYIITYRFSGWGYDREARLGFIGPGHLGGEEWNARPAAGTQTIPASVITSIRLADGTRGRREDTRRYLGRRAGGEAR